MFGLINCESVEKFSLHSVIVESHIQNLLAVFSSKFTYRNSTDTNSEALFSFPLDGSCAVYHFEAKIGGKTIVGVCKEIDEARNIYKVAKEAGHKAAIIERNSSMSDTFKCSIGNFPKNSDAEITLKFVMELNLSMDKSKSNETDRFCLCLPLILRPRYTPADYDGDVNVFNVTNKYHYEFRATVTGTKEIRNIFSNNYQLGISYTDERKTSARVILESTYDGTHDLDVNIDYSEMKVPSVIYEYGVVSDQYKGKEVNGAFYRTDVAMLNFLPKFDKKTSNKIEIVFIVDRSGSMGGSNITNAKECLLIFLKSLPTICKLQIYGFGSTFDKAFPQPVLYDEQSIDTAMNYQRNLNADFGGTELMLPLRDLYSSPLSSDYTRIAFLLTDGDVGNQDEVFGLVRQHNGSTRLFTVGIGDGVSTSLVQKVADSGLGKAAFVRDSKTLSSSVIELLDIALNCDQFVNCKIEWICPAHVSVVTVPSTIKPVFSNYFLTVMCVINGLKANETIKCILSGQASGKDVKLSLDINGHGGVSDEEFRVHRLLAKYKIDEMATEIEDGMYELKKSLIELSLEANIVTKYTTFVAIDHDLPDNGFIVEEDSMYNIYEVERGLDLPGSDYDDVDCCMYLNDCVYDEDMQLKCENDSEFEYEEEDMVKLKQYGGGGYDQVDCMTYDNEEICFDSDMRSASTKNVPLLQPIISKCMATSEECFEGQKEHEDVLMYLVEKQNINGFWKFDENIISRIGLNPTNVQSEKPDSVNDSVWITVLIYTYLTTKLSSREKEWRLFAKKAKEWIELNTLYEYVMEVGRQFINRM